jgi:hypothetical protein
MKLEILFRPSECDPLLSKPKGKSNREIYDETVERLDKYNTELSGLKNRETKKAKSLAEQIEKYKVKVTEQKRLKDLPHLSEGAKKLLKSKMIEIRWGRRREIDNKYTTKGKKQEEISVTLYSLIKNRIFKNNKIRTRNKYFTGEIDIPWEDKLKVMFAITDAKSSYDVHTFYDNDGAIKRPNRTQGLGYMDLHPTVKQYHIANLLVNNTQEAIISLIYKESFNWKDGEVPQWKQIKIIKEHIFDKASFTQFCDMNFYMGLDEKGQEEFDSFIEIPMEHRIIEHTFERDNEEIEDLKRQIDKARMYMDILYGITQEEIKSFYKTLA